VCSHIAGYVGTKSILLYSSTFPNLTGPLYIEPDKCTVMEPSNRYGCDRPCHMVNCFRSQRSCIDNIAVNDVIKKIEDAGVVTKDAPPPKISGYTTTFNPNKYYPWRECIKSLLGFCDEVVVADGGSTDGTYEELKEWKKTEPKLKVYKRRWRDDEPGMDGILKAYARALCTQEFCWQQDADEIVHEKDYNEIKKLCIEMPRRVKMLTLPVLDLYGSSTTVRTDRGLWKWRLSRNLPEITHGIPVELRKKNEAGKVYCDKNICDGCFPINSSTGKMIDGQATFVTPDLAKVMEKDTKKYKEMMIEAFKESPSVFHYSWHNLVRRINVDLEFWDKQWSSLDQSAIPPETRFFPGVPRDKITPELIAAKAEEMKAKKLDGAAMDLITVDWVDQPEVIKSWL